MTLLVDPVKGWVTHQGDPLWRATQAAVRRVKGQEMKWLDHPRRVHVAHLTDGKPVALIRCYPRMKRFSVTMEGFEFWSFNRVLGHEHFKGVAGFDRLRDARAFVTKIIEQAQGEQHVAQDA